MTCRTMTWNLKPKRALEHFICNWYWRSECCQLSQPTAKMRNKTALFLNFASLKSLSCSPWEKKEKTNKRTNKNCTSTSLQKYLGKSSNRTPYYNTTTDIPEFDTNLISFSYKTLVQLILRLETVIKSGIAELKWTVRKINWEKRRQRRNNTNWLSC